MDGRTQTRSAVRKGLLRANKLTDRSGLDVSSHRSGGGQGLLYLLDLDLHLFFSSLCSFVAETRSLLRSYDNYEQYDKTAITTGIGKLWLRLSEKRLDARFRAGSIVQPLPFQRSNTHAGASKIILWRTGYPSAFGRRRRPDNGRKGPHGRKGAGFRRHFFQRAPNFHDVRRCGESGAGRGRAAAGRSVHSAASASSLRAGCRRRRRCSGR